MTLWTTANPTSVLRWLRTHDDNVTSMELQQEWEILTYGNNGVTRDTEWRKVPLVDGGLKV